MEFSFIVLTWNSEKYIDTCINSIVKEGFSHNAPFEIFIIDNGSSDLTPEIIRKLEKEHLGIIKPIFFSTNIGTTKSRNVALEKATGRLIVIMDSDAQLLPGVISSLRKTLLGYSNIGLVVPRLIYPDGRHQKSTDIFPTVSHKIKRFFWLKKIENAEPSLISETGPVEVDYAISALWMFPRSIIQKVGFLDEKIFYAPEDVDFCLRVWQAGLKVVYDPRCLAIHDAQEISRGIKISKSTVLHIAGLLYFFKKHKYIFKKPAFST
ncbi:MAG: glycosyltransferase [Desulfobacterium sp.]|nr:glycosyltransferase [Desulfobacterium sp.]